MQHCHSQKHQQTGQKEDTDKVSLGTENGFGDDKTHSFVLNGTAEIGITDTDGQQECNHIKCQQMTN